MDDAKIRLSPAEKSLVLDAEMILTKNRVLRKAEDLLGIVQTRLEERLKMNERMPAEVLKVPAKISRGENYEGLPYRVLDYPRYFERKDMFAVRTMFWWANFMSVTLLLSGRYGEIYTERILRSYYLLGKEEYWYCVNDDPWEHHFGEGNYRRIDSMNADEWRLAIGAGSFIKIAKRIPLERWDDSVELIPDAFGQLIGVLID